MKIKLFSSSCLILMLICAAAGFITLFVGSILVTQSENGLAFPTAIVLPSQTPQSATRLSTTKPLSITNAAPVIGVTIDVPTTAPSDSPIATNSNTNGLPVNTETITPPSLGLSGNTLGTLDYPLTVTAQSYVQGTKVNAYRGNVNATRTAAAARGQLTQAALTLTAGVSKP